MRVPAALLVVLLVIFVGHSTTAQQTDPNIDPALAGLKQLKYAKVKLTGYCSVPPCVSEYYAQFKKTASGLPVKVGHCASDWRVYGRGSIFYVPGYGPCVVEDTGNQVEGKHLDLYFNSYEEALDFGYKQNAKVAILKYRSPCIGKPSRCAFRFVGDTEGYRR